MKYLSDIHVISTDDMIDDAVATVSHLMCSKEPLEVVLAIDEEFEVQGQDEVVAAFLNMGGFTKTLVILDIDLKNRESPRQAINRRTTKSRAEGIALSPSVCFLRCK